MQCRMLYSQAAKLNAEFLFDFGDALSKLNRFSEAVARGKRAVAIDPTFWLAYGAVIAWCAAHACRAR